MNAFSHVTTSRWKQADVWASLFFQFLVLAVLGIHMGNILRISHDFWSAARLSCVYSLRSGYSLYLGEAAGPITTFIYTPLATLLYLPITYLTKHPVSAILWAEIGSLVLLYAPAFVLYWKASKNLSNKIYTAIAFLTFSAINRGPDIHVDTPALFFSMLACLSLFAHGSHPQFLFLCSLFSVLAVACKQTFIPVALVLPVFTAIAYGRRSFFLHLSFVLLLFAILCGALLVIWKPDDILFNIWTVPLNHPWQSKSDDSLLFGMARWKFLGSVLILWFQKSLPFLILLIVSFPYIRKVPPKDSLPLLLAIVGIALIPAALLNYAKVGGGIYTFEITHYFISAAALTGLLHALSLQLKIRWLLLVFAFVAIFLGRFLYAPATLRYDLTHPNPNAMAYSFSKQYPGEMYFPWRPLSQLLAEGHLYHFSYGVLDREYAGFPPSEHLIRAHIPKDMKRIGFFQNENRFLLKYFPEYSVEITFPEMPGWTFFIKEKP